MIPPSIQSVHNRFLAAVAAILISATGISAQTTVTVSDRPALGTNTNYVGFRAPLQNAPLIKLPVGKVQPKGWLRKYLELQKEGLNGK